MINYLTDSRKLDALPEAPENFRRHTTARKIMNFFEQSIGHDPGTAIPPRSLDAGGRDELSLAVAGFAHVQSVYICTEAQGSA
jgi:hypothetical protein